MEVLEEDKCHPARKVEQPSCAPRWLTQAPQHWLTRACGLCGESKTSSRRSNGLLLFASLPLVLTGLGAESTSISCVVDAPMPFLQICCRRLRGLQHSRCGRSAWLQHMPSYVVQHFVASCASCAMCRCPGRRKCCQGHPKSGVVALGNSLCSRDLNQHLMRPSCPAALDKFWTDVHLMPSSQLCLQRW